MSWMTMLAQLLLSLSFLVAVHEMGHLLAAKYFGMRVEQFSIGFPPKIWSFRKGETEYAISAIPLGGYVKISGMIDESLDTEAMKQPPQSWEFRAKPAWQRLIVMLGGIIVNVIIGVIIFIGITFVIGDTYIKNDVVNAHGGYMFGPIGKEIGFQDGDKVVKINGKEFKYMQDIVMPGTLLGDDSYYTVDRDSKMVDIPIPSDFISKFGKKSSLSQFLFPRFPAVIDSVVKETTADRAGLQKGDHIVEVDGKPVFYYDEFKANLDTHVKDSLNPASDTIRFKVKRGEEVLAFTQYFKHQKTLGIYVNNVLSEDFVKEAEEHIAYGFLESIPKGTERAFTTLFVQIKAFGKMITGGLSPQKSLSGPIGIMQQFGDQWDWSRFWSLTGVLSLVLAFMNLLPIPALDGGHVMFLTYEIISRRKPSDKFLENAQKIGMVLLLGLMVFIFANDIHKLFVD